MAKTKVESSAGRSNRFRMIVIDSDLSDDAIGNLTQAITHALRPANSLPPAKPAPRTNGAHALPAASNGDESAADVETFDADAEAEQEVAESESTATASPNDWASRRAVWERSWATTMPPAAIGFTRAAGGGCGGSGLIRCCQ